MIPYRTLGRTGERVSAIGIGGYHLGKPYLEESESIRIIRTAIDSGITFLDNSWDYYDGQSELRMGKALRNGYRHRAFLMTKIDGRDRATAARQIDESLRRLQTERVDLLQHHEVIRMDDADRIFAAGGAMEAVLEAKRAGKVRYIELGPGPEGMGRYRSEGGCGDPPPPPGDAHPVANLGPSWSETILKLVADPAHRLVSHRNCKAGGGTHALHPE